ncbi:hypothetical protein BN8_04972 [Fibrisoma limi BUZ 3]|uniref:Lipoprotein n=1 Tax=Fibrisoma limi BUZ 3 TaxID=1185876 RepID=I2GP64_9BACT|nr:hypothetical protein BN8_04972 [Fibrisoma limi BUZ 3]
MKLFYLLSTVAFLLSACQKDQAIGPDNLLYQRWNMYQTKRIGDNAWMVYDLDAFYDTEYRPDGTLVYRQNGQVINPCCLPSKFRKADNLLRYSERNPCNYVLCAQPNSATITKLSNSLLELNDGVRITQYRPVQ